MSKIAATKQHAVQAVLVADLEDALLGPLSSMASKSLLPVLGKPLIDYALKQLEFSPVQEVFVFAKDPEQRINEHLKQNWNASRLNIKYFACDDAKNFADFIRELDRRALIKGNFVLMTTDVVSNIDLAELLQWHKVTRSRDDGCIMTCVYGSILNDRPADSSTSVIVYSDEGKILSYDKKLFKSQKTKVPLVRIKENQQVQVAKGLSSTGIYICSAGMPIIFTDNADYDTMDHLVKGVIGSEDIADHSIYLRRLNKGHASRVYSPESYDESTHRLMERWIHPLASFDYRSKTYSLNRSHTLVGKGVTISGYVSGKNSIIGDNCTIGPECKIVQSVIGPNCVIGSNVTLVRAYLFDSVTVESGSSVTCCILASNVTLYSKCVLEKGCVLGKNVSVGPEVHLTNQLISSPGEGRALPSSSFLGKKGSGSLFTPSPEYLLHRTWHGGDFVPPSDPQSDSESDDSVDDYEYADDENQVKTFYNEILDNFKRGLTENVTCENLILEVNSMKHAYNIPIDEVTIIVIQALLQLPSGESSNEYKAQLFATVDKFFPLINNYIRSPDSQAISLPAIEEVHLFNGNKFNVECLVRLLKYFYDKELIEDDFIVDWFNSSPSLPQLLFEECSSGKRKALRKETLLKNFVEWLEGSSEEDSQEEEEEEDEDSDE